MCKNCMEQYLISMMQMVPEAPKARPLSEKHQKERQELIEKQAKEEKEASLESHQKEGWLNDEHLNQSRVLEDIKNLRDAILSLQKQFDAMIEEFKAPL